jgi:hypothetical protein
MEELFTTAIPSPIRVEGQRQPRPYAAPRHLERRTRTQSEGSETNEEDEPLENSEPAHHVDVSV